MDQTERQLRESIIDACLEMNASGLNQGTSGNISARFGDRMLITPSATPYEAMTADMLASVQLDDGRGAVWDGPLRPSTEWRFHQKLLAIRPDAGAVVHAHPPFCTSLAIARRDIPACHYMVAAFGGDTVRCAGYATFGTEELSKLALSAMEDRTACLLANHGMITLGRTLVEAMWRAVELEAIARQYVLSLQIGGPVLLAQDDMAAVRERFGDYGRQND